MDRQQHSNIEDQETAGDRTGKIKYGLFAWLLGLPLPIILIAMFWGGCDF